MSDDRNRAGSERPGTGLDEAIDRAVRRIMDVEPRPGLRHRVLARIETPAARVPLLPRFAYAGAALALMVLATLVLRNVPSAPVEDRQRPVEVAQAPPAAQPPSSTTTIAPPPSTTTTQPARPRATRAEAPAPQPPERRVSAASLVDDDLATPPFAAGANPQPEPPAPPQAAIQMLAPIVITPLVIEPLRIEPIPPPK